MSEIDTSWYWDWTGGKGGLETDLYKPNDIGYEYDTVDIYEELKDMFAELNIRFRPPDHEEKIVVHQHMTVQCYACQGENIILEIIAPGDVREITCTKCHGNGHIPIQEWVDRERVSAL